MIKQRKQLENLKKILESQTTRPSILIKTKQKKIFNAGFEIIPKNALKIGEILGKGQFGTVKKAFLGEKIVAVKELQEKKMDESSKFVKELLTMIQLGYHPNILRVFGAVTECLDFGKLMICMEFCEHGSLKELIAKRSVGFFDERTNLFKYCAETIDSVIADKILEGKISIGYKLATR